MRAGAEGPRRASRPVASPLLRSGVLGMETFDEGLLVAFVFSSYPP